MGKHLVIVESPAKARTIAKFLGRDFTVESSIGHIRDLPKRAGDIPEKYKKEPWARLGVNVEDGFKPLYVVDDAKRSHVANLKALVKNADVLYLATDEDREGESIAWHLFEVLKPKVPVKRMVFHEITEKAIKAALLEPREIDQGLVNAQEARRILDRLYGYEVSPVLWKKVMPKLSAGRVQSVATRAIVQRERARIAFVPASYFTLSAELRGQAAEAKFSAELLSVAGERVAVGRDFNELGQLKNNQARILGEAEAEALAEALRLADLSVKSLERKPYKRSPYPPFMTSTLQQEAGRKLRFAAARTMRSAQKLYENGYITYMRTDSLTLSETAMNASRAAIARLYGADYLPPKARIYSNKVKNAQEAHEAIRPAGEDFPKPERVAAEVGADEAKLYELIWKRTIASQMADATGESLSVRIAARLKDSRELLFGVSGKTIAFPGFLRAYVEGSDDPEAELEDRETRLPPLKEGDALRGEAFKADGHATSPPARFTEASLVRYLEQIGVGRPSTYASILTTVQDRGYVWQKGSALVPSFTAFAVVSLLEKHFPNLVDEAFTARMEDELDAIGHGKQALVPWLRAFYFGEKDPGSETLHALGLQKLVTDNLEAIDARAINSIPIGTTEAGEPLVARVGRYGPYLEAGDQKASIPEDLPPDELTEAHARVLLAAPNDERIIGKDPESGQSILAKAGRFGPYVQVGEGGAGTKPKTASLFKHMSLATITLEESLALLSLPRTVGIDPESQTPITAHNGRFGPYIARGKDSRSLPSEEALFSVTLPEALALFAQPKSRGRGNSPAAAPLRELGAGPEETTITIKSGRFGPYVTDGTTHASLKKGQDPESITLTEALDMLAEKRAKGPSKPKGRGAARKPTSAKKPKRAAGKPKTGSAKKTTAKKDA